MTTFDQARQRRIGREERLAEADEIQTKRELDYLDWLLSDRPAEVARLMYALKLVGKGEDGSTTIRQLERRAQVERGALPTFREWLRPHWIGGVMRGCAGVALLYGFLMLVGICYPQTEGHRTAATYAMTALIGGAIALWYVGPRSD